MLLLQVISKSLGKSIDSEDYKSKLPHVELARRMAARDPSTAPHVGDRVPYVIIKGTKGGFRVVQPNKELLFDVLLLVSPPVSFCAEKA